MTDLENLDSVIRLVLKPGPGGTRPGVSVTTVTVLGRSRDSVTVTVTVTGVARKT